MGKLKKECGPGEHTQEQFERMWEESDFSICECGCKVFETKHYCDGYETLGKCTKCGHIHSLHSG